MKAKRFRLGLPRPLAYQGHTLKGTGRQAAVTSRRFLLLSGTVLLLTACIPFPTLHYNYIAPESEQGQQCVAQCLTQKNICQNDEVYRRQHCEQEYNILAQDIESGAARKEFIEYHRGEQDCDIQGLCERLYNVCFQNCGGRIEIQEYE